MDDAKAVMILSRSYSSLAFIVAATVVAASSGAGAGDVIDPTAGGRCAALGTDAVDLGDGVCGRVAGHTRIEVHSRSAADARNASASGWTVNGTSSANLRSDSSGMVPGAFESHHLRVRSGLNSYNPFR